MNMNVIDGLIQNGNRMLVAVAQFDKQIAGLKAQIAGLPAKYAIPADIKGTVGGGHATQMLADEKRSLERQIAQLTEARDVCKNQASHNLGTPHSYYLGRMELSPTNSSIPSPDPDLVSACHAASLITWGNDDDLNPAGTRDGDAAKMAMN
jgi:hypothetical protein